MKELNESSALGVIVSIMEALSDNFIVLLVIQHGIELLYSIIVAPLTH